MMMIICPHRITIKIKWSNTYVLFFTVPGTLWVINNCLLLWSTCLFPWEMNWGVDLMKTLASIGKLHIFLQFLKTLNITTFENHCHSDGWKTVPHATICISLITCVSLYIISRDFWPYAFLQWFVYSSSFPLKRAWMFILK